MTRRTAPTRIGARTRLLAGALACGLAFGPAPAVAQPPPGAPAAEPAPPRPGVERLSAIVQQRLQLTDEQTARLRETSAHYGAERAALLRDERQARRTVREEVARGDAADQTRVQGALDRLYQIQQRRTELAAAEQRDLAGFLSPTQRAQFAGLQERAFRAAQAIRERREAAGLGAPGIGAPDVNAQQQAREAQRAAAASRREQRQAERAARQAERAARQAARAAHPRPR